MPEFYVKCEKCDGKGKSVSQPTGREYRCYRCNGHGQLLSEFGEKLLKFLKENGVEFYRHEDY